MSRSTTLALLAAGVALAVPAAASAATFAAPAPLAGFGSAPAGAEVDTSALFTDGRSAVVGLAANGTASSITSMRVAFAAGQPGALPSPASPLGRTGPYGLDVDTDPDGLVSSTWTVGGVASLSRCSDGGCAPTVHVGTSPLKPQSAVAVQPGTGRTIVMWRGRAPSGAKRLQWRITTGSRLGAVHTLGELGTLPQLATDDSGRTVTIWVGSDGALRTASRRRGEFTRPTTIARSGVASPQLVVNATSGRWTAAWLASPSGVDAEDPSGTVTTTARTATTAFAAPTALGTANAFTVSASPGGNVLVVAQRGTSAPTVLTARSTGGPFTALQPIDAPISFLSTTFPARGAIDDAGNAVVSWSSGTQPGSAVPSGTFATTTTAPGRALGAVQQLATDGSARPTAPSIGRGIAQVAFGTSTGPQVTRAPLG